MWKKHCRKRRAFKWSRFDSFIAESRCLMNASCKITTWSLVAQSTWYFNFVEADDFFLWLRRKWNVRVKKKNEKRECVMRNKIIKLRCDTLFGIVGRGFGVANRAKVCTRRSFFFHLHFEHRHMKKETEHNLFYPIIFTPLLRRAKTRAVVVKCGNFFNIPLYFSSWIQENGDFPECRFFLFRQAKFH